MNEEIKLGLSIENDIDSIGLRDFYFDEQLQNMLFTNDEMIQNIEKIQLFMKTYSCYRLIYMTSEDMKPYELSFYEADVENEIRTNGCFILTMI